MGGNSKEISISDMKKMALEKVNLLSGEAIKLLQQMIRIPSFNPPVRCSIDEAPGDEREIANFTAAYLREQGMEVKQIEPFENRISNIARLHGSLGTPRLLFNSHLDTLAPGDPANWSYPPLSGELHDGMIWGLGAKNMKSGMASAMFATRILKECGFKLKGDLLITQTAGEMQGGHKGLQVIVKNRMVDADYAVYTECDPPLKVEIAHRGAVRIDITVRGYSVHTTDYAGKKPINAITKMLKVIPAINNMEFTHWSPHPHLPGKPIISTNLIWGGHAENMHADKCTIRCDCRTIPPQTTETVMADIEKALNRLRAEDPELDVKAEVYREASPSFISPDEPIVKALQAAIKEVTGQDVPAGGVGSTSDSRWLILGLGIPTPKFMFPTVGSETDEREKVEDYLNTIRVYITLILNLLA